MRAAATQALDLYQRKGNRPGARDSLRYLADHAPAGKDSPMVNSEVPKVELNDNGDIVLTVQLVGVAGGKPVEICGFITQNSGAYISFRETRKVPKADSDGAVAEATSEGAVPEATSEGVKLPVTVPSKNLISADEPVTVVTWVSEVWPSMLKPDTDTGKIKPTWIIDSNAAKKVWAAAEGWGSNAPAPGEKPSTTGPSP